MTHGETLPAMVSTFSWDQRIGNGGFYSDNFAIAGLVYKLFKRNPQFPPRQNEEGKRRVFKLQCEAYLLAHGDSYLT